MRPIFRGNSPQTVDYAEHRDAFFDLASCIGMFCSYCERRIGTNLAVEHIQPQELYGGLKGRWDNFLLGCVNCNSTKGHKDVALSDILLPDRDNTAAAYTYSMDGTISTHASLSDPQKLMAQATLALTGLDKTPAAAVDSNGKLVAVERLSQRMQVWLIAQESKKDLHLNPNDAFRRQVARTALGHGFFSIWMTVFQDDPDVRRLLIQEFTGTAADCFDARTTSIISPRPHSGLPHGCKT